MMTFVKNLFSRLNWKVYPTTILGLISLFAIIPCILWLPAKYANENSFFENLQLFILGFAVIFALKNKEHKSLFKWFAMLSFILFLREINCGRILFPYAGSTTSFKTWKEILPHYSWLPNTLYGLFMLFTLVYFFYKKLYHELWLYIKSANFPAIDIILFLLGIILGTLGETSFPNEMFEEVSETMFYFSFMSIIYLYTFNPIFKLKKKK
ncbi:hypothetical protein HDR60_01750 [bacterium]|nr:hypothetical protein [bacterium]